MDRRLASLAVLLLLTREAPAQRTAPSALDRDPKGWLDLQPGKDLKGWKRVPLAPDTKLDPRNPWKADGNVLHCAGTGIKEMFIYDKPFEDGIFHVEWRFKKVANKADGSKPDYNSGVYVRSVDGKLWHQVQLAHLPKPPLLGDIFGDWPVNGKVERVIVRGKGGDERAEPPGEWNTFEITCKGKTISVWLNGATTLTWSECQVPRGHVGLQAEFYDIEFRKLKFKPLAP